MDGFTEWKISTDRNGLVGPCGCRVENSFKGVLEARGHKCCSSRLHDHPLPTGYLAAQAEGDRRTRSGWSNRKCPQCGRYGWEKP